MSTSDLGNSSETSCPKRGSKPRVDGPSILDGFVFGSCLVKVPVKYGTPESHPQFPMSENKSFLASSCPPSHSPGVGSGSLDRSPTRNVSTPTQDPTRPFRYPFKVPTSTSFTDQTNCDRRASGRTEVVFPTMNRGRGRTSYLRLPTTLIRLALSFLYSTPRPSRLSGTLFRSRTL